jgi:hypothetical protein
MPRKQEHAVRDMRPIAVRVPDDVHAVLDVARAAYGHRSLQELLAPIVEAFAMSLAEKPQIKAMLRGRAELQAEAAGTLTSLESGKESRRTR